jgi:uncharacterized membrane protein
MEDLASLETKSRRNLYIIGILVAVAVILFALLPSLNLDLGLFNSERVEIVASYSGTLEAGGNVSLTIEIRNIQGTTLTIDKVVLVAYESDKISLSPGEVLIGQIAPEGYRRLKFNINATEDALDGKYVLEVKTEYPDTTTTDTLDLFVGDNP